MPLREPYRVGSVDREGRRTGHDPAIFARVPKDVLEKLDTWAEAKGYDRSEAEALLLAKALGKAK